MVAVDLFTIPYSPWSEKARWALDHHRIGYRESRRYLPGLTTRWLALRYGLGNRLTLPLLVAGRERVVGSLAIARWAERHGAGSELFPGAQSEAIESFDRASEEALDAGRTLYLHRLLDSESDRRLVLPAWAATSRLLHRGIERRCRLLLDKYQGKSQSTLEQRERLANVFRRLRATLSDGRRYLTGEFSFADIAAASAVHYLAPVVHPRVPIAPRSRAVWVVAGLDAEFADLIWFRDRLYAERR
jgi:glutathione S-transferase